jgi:desulfoferrodoxin (superoxide reductase-like protein)
MDFIDTRTRSKLGTPGPFIGIITNNLDPTFMGRLEVALIKGLYPDPTEQANTYIVKYLSPFYGVTSDRYQGTNGAKFDDVQKSYGMWMVPPDIGTKVLVIFIDGDTNQGYWIGCIMDQFQNHMVPGIAASSTVSVSQEQKRQYTDGPLPVGEFLKSSKIENAGPNVNKFEKPLHHHFANRLREQGLLADNIRGITSSSARREAPSKVFGISTPGPLDPKGKQDEVGYKGHSKIQPVSRLGGTTFVMDDGDKNGDNELMRIRTRTGHQILFHNTHDLIYIANSRGTSWIELTSDGKIDIYSRDSISIHSEADFNFRAERDINLEAGRNINIHSVRDFNINVDKNHNIIVGVDGKIQYKGNLDQSIIGSTKLKSDAGFDLKVKGDIKQTASSNFNIVAGANNNFSANGNTNISTQGQHIESAKAIHMNGPTAAIAAPAAPAVTPNALSKFSLPNTDPVVGWTGTNYTTTNMVSIMQRVPVHEPWIQHENNTNRSKVNSSATDVLTGTANKKAE